MSHEDESIQLEQLGHSATQIQTSSVNERTVGIRLFSTILCLTLLKGIYDYALLLVQKHHWSILSSYSLPAWIEIVELQTNANFEDVVLSYKLYEVFTSAFIEPNIILAVLILMTSYWVFFTIESNTSTPVIFYQIIGEHVYILILKLILDGLRFYLVGNCFCFNSGMAAAWTTCIVKLFYYNHSQIKHQTFKYLTFLSSFAILLCVVILKQRVDVGIALVVALIEILCFEGGTIKYPLETYEEKQKLAEWLKLSKLSMWASFNANQYGENCYMVVDTWQFYVERKNRKLNVFEKVIETNVFEKVIETNVFEKVTEEMQ